MRSIVHDIHCKSTVVSRHGQCLVGHPEVFPNFYPRLGGMHTLMSFVGCMGSLMSNSGLEEVLKAAFAGIPKMLSGKNFPQNIQALQMVAEAVLRNDLEEPDNYDQLIPLFK